MRSISLKITLVLVIVSLAGALFAAFYLQNWTRQAFDDFIRGQDQELLVSALTEHYQAAGSWDGVEQVFQDIYGTGMRGYQNRGGMGMDPPFSSGLPFVLASPSGLILSGGTNTGKMMHGMTLSDSQLDTGIPIKVNGKSAGWLVPAPFPKNRNNPQQNFLSTVREGLLISSLVTLLIALTLGGVLIQSFTRPLRKLADATATVASGELGYQVDIQSGDELGQLAESFNSMSADLELADQTRKQMTADIAHDLRTPLSVLTGYTEAMSAGKLEGNQEIYRIMHQQTQHLNYLIDDLRTLSLLDSNQLHLQTQNIDPGIILAEACSAFSALAEEKGIQLSIRIADDLPRIDLDPDRLNQILGNLISNSLNVLHRGGEARISAQQVAGQLEIEVWDNGPGIGPDHLKHVFDRFYRIDQSRQSDGSSGLGLAITRKLVQAMGGEIRVSSTPGQETSFVVEFPLG